MDADELRHEQLRLAREIRCSSGAGCRNRGHRLAQLVIDLDQLDRAALTARSDQEGE